MMAIQRSGKEAPVENHGMRSLFLKCGGKLEPTRQHLKKWPDGCTDLFDAALLGWQNCEH
jgi:hypothetical protein